MKKKQFKEMSAWFVVVCMLVNMLVPLGMPYAGAGGLYDGGSGTEGEPFQIATAEHLNNVRNNLDAHFVQTADIVFDAADFEDGGDFYNGGDGWVPIGKKICCFPDVASTPSPCYALITLST